MPYFSERDVEIPKLFEFLYLHTDEIKTILDVGCRGSQYLLELKKAGKIVDGIDFDEGKEEKEILRNYYIGDFLERDFDLYDLVVCISTIEHYGIKQNPDPDYTGLQLLFFEKLLLTAKKFLFCTFPYGEPAIHEKEFSIIFPWLLDRFIAGIEPNKLELEFYYNDEPQKGEGWREITREEAGRVRYDSSKGVQCVCILKVKK